MFLHVTSVSHITAYQLRVEFSNEVAKQVDLVGEPYGEVFEPLLVELAAFDDVSDPGRVANIVTVHGGKKTVEK